jgi:3',5'-cyclic-AMP phosphodiesterase
VTFICGGAVCGASWRGPYRGFSEGFGLIDLHPDGRFDYRYIEYGWKPQA